MDINFNSRRYESSWRENTVSVIICKFCRSCSCVCLILTASRNVGVLGIRLLLFWIKRLSWHALLCDCDTFRRVYILKRYWGEGGEPNRYFLFVFITLIVKQIWLLQSRPRQGALWCLLQCVDVKWVVTKLLNSSTLRIVLLVDQSYFILFSALIFKKDHWGSF